MDYRTQELFTDCNNALVRLKEQCTAAEEDAHEYIGGDLLTEYEKARKLNKERIEKIQRELNELQQYLQQLEMQMFM